ncbi:hypothetical protein PV379_05335 [Streptomyces caniscabiei]|uniref:hypothetical protein n=1 Tax=Streptomyces caniscabiei TaxID=2746961 RepID=UPI0029BCE6F0|nr:hypothetical protein [Streptomyces caniscabiei]MDX2599648.1 hypothetical protein [Streptomyces caniscabiei]MDX2735057.1 hypothetical protein [Streptomyces caniscabiei]MDX2776753.1 hypothetical protein [Streptomyces caniscabiei]
MTISEQDPSAVGMAVAVLSDEERGTITAMPPGTERTRRLAVRAGLRLLLAACQGESPRHIVVTDGLCPRCGAAHDFTAGSEQPVYFSLAHDGDLVVYALAETAVGLGLAVLKQGGLPALQAARKSARLEANPRALGRGCCGSPRAGGAIRSVAYADTPAPYVVAVSNQESPPCTQDSIGEDLKRD